MPNINGCEQYGNPRSIHNMFDKEIDSKTQVCGLSPQTW